MVEIVTLSIQMSHQTLIWIMSWSSTLNENSLRDDSNFKKHILFSFHEKSWFLPENQHGSHHNL